MDDFSVEVKGLDEFQDALNELEKSMPKEFKRLLRTVGNKAKIIVARKANQSVNLGPDRATKSGKQRIHYIRSIKRGKVFKDRNTGEWTVRVYSKDYKAHLIEKGHRIVDKNGVEHGFQPGKHVFAKSGSEIEQQMHDIVEAELDKLLRKL